MNRRRLLLGLLGAPLLPAIVAPQPSPGARYARALVDSTRYLADPDSWYIVTGTDWNGRPVPDQVVHVARATRQKAFKYVTSIRVGK